jgi:phosphoribosylanthranilate isomerase
MRPAVRDLLAGGAATGSAGAATGAATGSTTGAATESLTGATTARPRVKICGVTSPADAVICHRAGADLLGVILAASARQVTVGQARAIREVVPTAALVGVVTSAAPAAVAAQVAAADLDAVQLHGCADPEAWVAVALACGRPVLPAVTADLAGGVVAAFREVVQERPQALAGLLLDLPKPPPPATAIPSAGPSGAAPAPGVAMADLAARQAALRRAARQATIAGVPTLLAGGLTHHDVPVALRESGCRGVDLCRGTERAPGEKDPELVRRVLAAARAEEVPRAS